ncbi:MAG: DUF3592 domain-containing protein [Chitinophagaceae bacterium]
MWYTITLAVGLLLLVVALSKLQKTLSFLKMSERATGTVIELERVKDSDGDTFKPIFKFETKNHQQIIHRHIGSSNPSSWSVGDEVMIAYDSADPSEARVLTYFGTFSWTIILGAIAMPLIIVGGGYYVSLSYLR